MTERTAEWAADLRRAFDESFAAARWTDRPELEDVLAVRVGGEPYALAARELSGLVAEARIVRIPSPVPEFLGVAGVHGTLVPVYGLARLLGHADSGSGPRWLALCGGVEPLALAFAELEGYFRLPRTAFHAPGGSAEIRKHVRQVVTPDAAPRFVVDVPSVIAAIKRESGPPAAGGPR